MPGRQKASATFLHRPFTSWGQLQELKVVPAVGRLRAGPYPPARRVHKGMRPAARAE